MHRRAFFLTISGFLLLTAAPANAAHWLDWIAPPGVPDFERPYHEEGKMPHNSQYDERNQPYVRKWADRAGGNQAFLKRLYDAQIITDQYMDDDVPVVEVGYGFMRLSGQDKRRVMDFIDHMFRVTNGVPGHKGMFHVYHWLSGDPIGVYTKYGLQLQ